MDTPTKIIIIGVDHLGLGGKEFLLSQCHCLFAAKRFRPLLSQYNGEVFPLTPLSEALSNISRELGKGTIAVLASGDPLFFGIGKTLIQKFGSERIEIHPGLSSMQLAFSRFKEPWQECTPLSLHGRSLDNLFARIHQHQCLFLLTDQTNSPNAIASHLLQESRQFGAGDLEQAYTMFVGENLGFEGEKCTIGSLSEIASGTYGDLNVMIIKQNTPILTSPFLGLHESEIQHSRGLITKDEVRAVTLHRLQLPARGIFWDIGAGSGSISIEAAQMQANLEIYSIEKKAEELTNIRANRARYQAVNMRVIPGSAPEALINLPPPDRVFIGGSGGNLAEIITHICPILAKNGRIVINAVIEKTRETAPRLLHQAGFLVDISEIRVSRSTYPQENNETTNFNPISIITGRQHDR